MIDMTVQQLKSLHFEDFKAPHQVLCYGGGGAFSGVVPYMVACGINIAGVIDASKKGSVKIRGMEFRYYSIDDAIEQFGCDAVIIITIANRNIMCQVEQNLIEKGFCPEKIFDLNVWTWLTVPSEKSYCPELSGYMQFMQCALSKCCNIGVVDAYLCEWYIDGTPIEKSVERFLEKRLYYMEQSQIGRVPIYCKGCAFLSDQTTSASNKLCQFIVSDHAMCNADCVYCSDACSEPRKQIGTTVGERYSAIIHTLEILQQNSLLAADAVVQFAGGEITINPYKQQIYEVVHHAVTEQPDMKVEFFSNCFIYDPGIAQIISISNHSFLQCDLDAGTPETYIKVKGFNKFETVEENLKKYAQQGRIRIKYIVLPGWNDSDADYDGTIALLKDLGLKELLVSPEFNMSRENDRTIIRSILYATARLMAALDRNGIQPIFPRGFWHTEHISAAKRLCRELQSLCQTGG